LRIVQVPVGEAGDSLSFFLILDDIPGARASARTKTPIFHALLDSLPLGLALADT
jgi:hypothetical protein